MAFEKLRGTLRDAADILRHTRSVREVARTFGPATLRPPIVLNADNDAATAPGADLVSRLAALRRRLQAEVLDDRGRVDYARASGGAVLADLTATAAELAGARLELRSDAETIAWWVNLYNVLTIHGVVALGIRASVMEVPTFFARVAYRVAGHVLTLDEIENGVLRRNAPHPVTGRRLWRDDDPRIGLAPSRVDPRVHAALVCAARSCPPIAIYEAARLDDQLRTASEAFVAGGLAIDDAARTITIPLVFRWYVDDFGGRDGLREFLRAHAGPVRPELERALAAGHHLVHARYDWTLNSAGT